MCAFKERVCLHGIISIENVRCWVGSKGGTERGWASVNGAWTKEGSPAELMVIGIGVCVSCCLLLPLPTTGQDLR